LSLPVTRFLDRVAHPLRGHPLAAAPAYLLVALAVTLLAAIALGTWLVPAWVAARILYPADVPSVRGLRATIIAFALQPFVNAAVVLLGGADGDPDRVRWMLIGCQGVLVLLAVLVPTGQPAHNGLCRRAARGGRLPSALWSSRFSNRLVRLQL
jgi:hypothetical protein